jgi:hypothetical protein
METTGKKRVECECGWVYEYIVNTKYPRRQDESNIRVGYGSN